VNFVEGMAMITTSKARVTRRSFMFGLATLPATLTRADDVEPPSRLFFKEPAPIKSADQVLNVMDFEPLARLALPPAHFGYIATGADDDRTLIQNQEAFNRYQIRAHRFRDLSQLHTSCAVFGKQWPSPVYLSAVSAMRAFHPDGELALARAARSRSMQLMLSTGSSTPVEAVMAAAGAPLWQQLYPTDDWAVTSGIVRRAERAGCSAIVLTVDSHGVRNNETLKRAMLSDSRTCTACHPGNSHDMWRRGPMFAELDVSRVTGLAPPALTVAFLDRLRALVKGRFIVKGIVTGEDAALAVEHGADAVVISNHGGRNEETLRATVDCLPEVVSAVRGRVPVFVDGGIRRGTDVFKALALGATAVGIGRPQAWGLAAFGQPGVEAVIDIFNRELAAIMRQAGTPSIEDIVAADVISPGRA
jgi:(S)-2-hydroxy-acid oxidase